MGTEDDLLQEALQTRAARDQALLDRLIAEAADTVLSGGDTTCTVARIWAIRDSLRQRGLWCPACGRSR